MAAEINPLIKHRLDELMPWYVNGQITAEDRAWVEARLTESEAARKALEWHQLLSENISDEVNSLPEEAGLQSLLKRIRADRHAAAQPTWMERVVEAWFAFARGPAMAVAAVLIVVQGGFITFLVSQDNSNNELGQPRSVSQPAAVVGPVLQVSFVETTGERELRHLMLTVGGRFIDGPDQFGTYVVAVAPERLDAAMLVLKSDARVTSLVVLARFVPKQ